MNELYDCDLNVLCNVYDKRVDFHAVDVLMWHAI